MGVDTSLTEIVNFDSNENKILETPSFLGDKIYSYSFSLLSIENRKLYFLTYLSNSNKNCIITKISLPRFRLDNPSIERKKVISTTLIHRIVNSFIFGENIAVFYLNNEKKLYLYINNINFTNEDIYAYIDSGGFRQGYGLFFKGLHIKDQLMGFIYYKTNSNSGLKMKIGYLDSSNQFQTKCNKEFSSYSFYTEEILNDFVKINDKRLAYLGVILNKPKKFKILLFDLK